MMRIKKLRLEAGISRPQLAERMGVTPYAVAGWEKETVLPRTRQLPLLAHVLGCGIEDLFVQEAWGSGK